ncbi:MAG: hypothetical protein WA755_14065 [Candidatus Acidiferrales bacterium]
MLKWLAAAVLALSILTAAMGLGSIVDARHFAHTTGPMPPTPWFAGHTTGPMPPTPW